jgi:Ca2+-binding RTX toxin-like protein
MGAGENTITGGQGNDQIRLNGSFDTVDAGDGDDLITLSLAGAAKIDGGAGNDRVVLDNFSSAGPLQFNHHQLIVNSFGSKQRAVDFNDTVELIVLNGLPAGARLTSRWTPQVCLI